MRGYQKKVIYMKNTGSSVFEEAYFVLSPDAEKNNTQKGDMITEANRIIEENFGRGGIRFVKKHILYVAAFLLGVLLAAALFLIFVL